MNMSFPHGELQGKFEVPLLRHVKCIEGTYDARQPSRFLLSLVHRMAW